MVGRDAAAVETMEIAIPDIEQAQAHWQVAGQRRGAEVLVHGMRARQQAAETLGPTAMATGRPMADQRE